MTGDDSSSPTFDGSVSLDVATYGKLSEDQIKQLKQSKLQALFSNASGEDVSDILDYSFAMVNNGNSVAKPLCFIHVVGCEQHRATALSKAANDVPQLAPGVRK